MFIFSNQLFLWLLTSTEVRAVTSSMVIFLCPPLPSLAQSNLDWNGMF